MATQAATAAPAVFDLAVVRDVNGLRFRAESVVTGQLEGDLKTSLDDLLRESWNSGRSALDDEARVRLGRKLFDSLFTGELVRHFDRFRGSAFAQGGLSVLRLRFRDGEPLAGLPWEQLHDGFGFIGKDSSSSVVRFLEGAIPIRSVHIEPPLRILLTGGELDNELDPLLKENVRALTIAYKEAPVQVSLKARPAIGWAQLSTILSQAEAERQPYHVWQHVGHGRLVANRYHLQLANGPVDFERIQHVVSACPNLQVAIFASCHSAAVEGAAQALAKLNLPLVFGFRQEVSPSVALCLTAALHLLLLRESPEIALCMARSKVASNHLATFEWAQGILYSRRQTPLLPLIDLPNRPSVGRPAQPAPHSNGNSVTVRGKGLRAGRDVNVKGADGQIHGTTVEVAMEDVDAGRDIWAIGTESHSSRYDALLKDLFSRLCSSEKL